MRMPVTLYRARLGFLFGQRLLMLQHTGRRTGVARYVVLEVLDRPRPGSYIVASGFGTRAQWFQNIAADPCVRLWAGARGPRSATARTLTVPEADATLRAYARRHERAWRMFKPVLESTLGRAITEEHAPLPMIELRLTSRPVQKADRPA
jgi:deazaflavin-dependent oxidoreductase (nitroreductase family)